MQCHGPEYSPIMEQQTKSNCTLCECDVCETEKERERANSQANIPTTQLLLAYHIVDLGCWEDCFALMKCLSYDTIISDGEKIVEWNCVGFLLLLLLHVV